MSQDSKTETQYGGASKLGGRWPSVGVREIFEHSLETYRESASSRLNRSNVPAGLGFEKLKPAFTEVCARIQQPFLVASEESSSSVRRTELTSAVNCLNRCEPQELSQSLSSVMAMLMHCRPEMGHRSSKTNDRRPRSRFSTFPNSPALSLYMAKQVFDQLCTRNLPKQCEKIGDARRFVERELNFRILDPSMEAGQLLLGIAQCWEMRVHQTHSPQSKSYKKLLQAGWEKLCRDVLYGIDMNPLAVIAVQTSFLILCGLYGVKAVYPQNTFTADSVQGELLDGLGI